MKSLIVLSLLFCSFDVLNCSANPARESGLPAENPVPAKNIIIVHGAFADGSGWEGVYRVLTKDGYNVTIVQNTTASLDADVTTTRNALAAQDGPAVLVGHSYGGAVITQAGDDPKVKSLVFVAAYVPDAGESVADLLAAADKSMPAPPILIDGQKGIALLDRAGFSEAFAADVDRNKAKFLAASQAPLGLQAVGTKITTAAWKTKPSYYIVASEDRMIPPADERKFALKANAVRKFEFKASHAVYISQPEKVAKVIEAAASN